MGTESYSQIFAGKRGFDNRRDGNGQRAWDYRQNSLQEPVGDVTN